MKVILNSLTPIATVLIWGILGGLSLVFLGGQEQPAMIVIPVAAVYLTLSIITVKLNRPRRLFLDLFTTTLSTFIFMCLIDYLFTIRPTGVQDPEAPVHHLMGWGLLILVGAAVSAFLTFLSTLHKQALPADQSS